MVQQSSPLRTTSFDTPLYVKSSTNMPITKEDAGWPFWPTMTYMSWSKKTTMNMSYGILQWIATIIFIVYSETILAHWGFYTRVFSPISPPNIPWLQENSIIRLSKTQKTMTMPRIRMRTQNPRMRTRNPRTRVKTRMRTRTSLWTRKDKDKVQDNDKDETVEDALIEHLKQCDMTKEHKQYKVIDSDAGALDFALDPASTETNKDYST